MKERLLKLMRGRYGVDQLNRFLLVISIISMIIMMVFGGLIPYVISSLLMICLYYRMFSRNFEKRYRENNQYLMIRNRVLGSFQKGRNTVHQRKIYHIYKCPGCGQKIRIPRGKGRISITCPKCQKEFIKRS